MVNKSNKSTKKSVKEVVVTKPEKSITSTQPSNEPEFETHDQNISQIVKDSIKENLSLLNAIGQDKPKEVLTEDTKPKPKKRKQKQKEPIILGLVEQKSQSSPNYNNYIYIFFGVLLMGAIAYYLYLQLKEFQDPRNKELRLLKELEKEGLESIDNVRKEE